jgi:penicillin-binding protein 1A
MGKQVDTTQFHKYIKRFWITYFALAAFIFVLFFSISLGLLGFMPSFEELENPKSNLATEIQSSDGVLLGKFFIENRSNVHFENLSPNIVNALIATEDARFTEHSGVDVRSIFRVIWKTILGRDKSSGGGSTITQQLAKNLFPRGKNPSKLKMFSVKLREWVTAVKLERNYTKEEILSMYLNTVDFGSQAFGIESASKTYFNKAPDSLKTEEAAMLVGLLKAPTKFSPIRNPENAKKRREVVLAQMEEYGFINQKQYDSLRLIPVDMSGYKIQDHTAGLATYFREYLRSVMAKDKPDPDDYFDKKVYKEDLGEWENNPLYGWCNKNKKADGSPYNIYKDGLRIYTTINSKMQKYAEEAVYEHLGKELQPQFYKHWKGVRGAPFDATLTKEQLDDIMWQAIKRTDRYISMKKSNISDDEIKNVFNKPVKMRIFTWKGEKDTIMTPLDSVKYYKWFLLAGLMSMEPQTGYVRAYVGGINYKYFKYDHVKSAKRQVGSTFKPFVYTLAMQEGEYSPCTKVPNVQVVVDLGDGTVWEPKNSSDYKEGEMVSLKEALANSINWVSAFLIKRYSPGPVVKIAKKMGIKSYVPEVYAICLGSADLTLYEMVGAFSTYPNKGVYTEPVFVTRIEDKHGNILSKFAPRSQEAMSGETAYLMIRLLQGVVESGTGARLRGPKYNLTNAIAGKTGTTDNNSDGWFMGVTPKLVTGVWVGAEDRSVHFRSTLLGQGANMSLPIWAIYMKKVYADKSLKVSPNDNFFTPSGKIKVELDCSKYENEPKHKNNFEKKKY